MATAKTNTDQQLFWQPQKSTKSASMLPWLGIAAIVILLDQLTKITITKHLRLGEEKKCHLVLQPGAGL
jgi:lipoprotein signal peptidase